MAAQPSERQFSMEEYLRLDRQSADARYEYIDGRLRMMSGGTANHAIISATLVGMLFQSLATSDCNVYTSDMRVQLSPTR